MENRNFRRNLFEIDNARGMSRDELADTFVPTSKFWRLLSAKNHIILGARGSGKTAIAKMLSHDHLCRLKDEDRAVKAIVSHEYIGIYTPTKLEWVGGLKNKPWQSEAEKEEFFQWRLNLTTCLAFLITLQSCLEFYIHDIGERAVLESKIVNKLSISWCDSEECFDTIRELYNHIEEIEFLKQQEIARMRVIGNLPPTQTPVGIAFSLDLFAPLKRAISITSQILNFSKNTTWLLCLDEAEYLDTLHHRILNSHLRTYSGNLFFKITTLPYAHYTLDTNTRVPLNVGHDFEYVYIDEDPITNQFNFDSRVPKFAEILFQKRANRSGYKYKDVRLVNFLGKSELIEYKKEDWSDHSENWSLLRLHGHPALIEKAEQLYQLKDKKRFQSNIARKLQPIFQLRDAVSNLSGQKQLDLYSGAAMIIRCSDGNPRRLIRIFNSLMNEAQWEKDDEDNRTNIRPLTPLIQNRIITSFSINELTRLQSDVEPSADIDLYNFIRIIGRFMQDSLHNQPVNTDQISSISLDRSTPAVYWEIVKSCVASGYLYPNIRANNPDQMPLNEGIFHLAYVLSPCFQLLPRRGYHRSLMHILAQSLSKKKSESLQMELDLPVEIQDEYQ